MLYSMTGFGKAQYEDEQIFIKVDIKSVNSKTFDLKLRLPLEFNYKEPSLRSSLQNMLRRGKVECYIQLDRQDKPPYLINTAAAKNYFDVIKDLAKDFKLNIKKFDIISTILRLPDVMRPNIIEEDEQTWQKIFQTVKQAVEMLNSFRKQEGEALEKDLLSKVDNIEQALHQVPNYEQERIEIVKQRILDALSQLKVEYDKERFEQEMIYYLDKFDINEEKVRLQNHINYFREVVADTTKIEKGKTLTFIAQEMQREINTLGAKANHFKIQQLVVIMKDEVEKIKEQLANVL